MNIQENLQEIFRKVFNEPSLIIDKEMQAFKSKEKLKEFIEY